MAGDRAYRPAGPAAGGATIRQETLLRVLSSMVAHGDHEVLTPDDLAARAIDITDAALARERETGGGR